MVRRNFNVILALVLVTILTILLFPSVFALSVSFDPQTLNGGGTSTLDIQKVNGENIAIEFPVSVNLALTYPSDFGRTDLSSLQQGQTATNKVTNLNNGNDVLIVIANDFDTTIRAAVSISESSSFRIYHLPSYIPEEQYSTMSSQTFSYELLGSLSDYVEGIIVVNPGIQNNPPVGNSFTVNLLFGESWGENIITSADAAVSDPDGDQVSLADNSVTLPCTATGPQTISYPGANVSGQEFCNYQLKDDKGSLSPVYTITFNTFMDDSTPSPDGGSPNPDGNDSLLPGNESNGDTVECPSFLPYILLEGRSSTVVNQNRRFFDLRGYIWDETIDHFIASIVGCDLGAIPTLYSFDYMNSDPSDKYYCYYNDPNTNYKSDIACWQPDNNVNGNDDFNINFEHKPIDRSGEYLSYHYNASWGLYTEDEASYYLDIYAPELSREQLYFWVKGTPNSQYKADIDTFGSNILTTGWKDSPLEWDITSITHALEEFNVTDVAKVTFSARSTDGNPAEVLFDDLKTHKEWYTLSIVSQTDQNVVNCEIIDNRYVDCIPYSLGESVITIEIRTAPLGNIAWDNFTFTVLNSPPEVDSVVFVPPLTSSNIVAQISGWTDPDGHPPLYQVEWYVDKVLQTSYTSSNLIQTLNTNTYNVNPNSEVSIVVTAVDPFSSGNSVSAIGMILDTPPLITQFDSNSPVGSPQDCDDSVVFEVNGYDSDSQFLFFTLDYGDGNSEIFTSSPGNRITLSHIYSPSFVQSFYTTLLNVSDGVNLISSSMNIELSCSKLSPPQKPESISNLKGIIDVNSAGLELRWDLPSQSSPNYDAIVICGIDSITNETDLSPNSPDFMSACNLNSSSQSSSSSNMYVLNKSDTSYTVNAGWENYYKVGTLATNKLTGVYEISLSNQTIGMYPLHLVKSDQYQWMSLPLLPEGSSVEYVLSSLGSGRGKDNSLYNCGFTDYNGYVDELRLFDIDLYKNNIGVGVNEDESVSKSNFIYKPDIDCRFYSLGLFDSLDDLSVTNGYLIKVNNDVDLAVAGEVLTSVNVPITSSMNNKSLWTGYPFVYPTDNNFDPSDAVVEYFDVEEYNYLISSGQSKTNALSSAYKVNLPGQAKQISEFEPGKGYRILSNQNTNLILDHPKK